jgi:hypothetical protein
LSSDKATRMGNVVGSLSEVQREVVIGTLLGDGSMRCETNALLEINHPSSSERTSSGSTSNSLTWSPRRRRNGRATQDESLVDSLRGACRL